MDHEKNSLLLPDVDFRLVRDGRRSSLFYYDVDLSTARSVAAGTHLVLPITGDSFYVDKNPTLVGNATVHFQDTSFGLAPAPVFCEPGAILKVPFTQVLIENAAQAGKIFRIHYGVDIDFQPGASSSVTVNGTVAISGTVAVSGDVSVLDVVGSDTQTYFYDGGVALGFATAVVFLPAANPNGAIIHSVANNPFPAAGGQTITGFMAALAAPASMASGANRYYISLDSIRAGGSQTSGRTFDLNLQRKIPAGWGLWHVVNAIGGAGSDTSELSYRLL